MMELRIRFLSTRTTSHGPPHINRMPSSTRQACWRWRKKATEKLPTDPIYLNTLGGMYMRAGKLEETLANLSMATSQREQLSDYEVTPAEKKFGHAMDLVLMCLAQFSAKIRRGWRVAQSL